MLTVLVWPPVERTMISGLLPLGLGYLKANTSGHEIKLVDAFKDQLSPSAAVSKIRQLDPDVVGISYWSFNTRIVKEIIRQLRDSLGKAVIIIGGPGPSAAPQMSLELTGADFAIKGEGEPGFGKFLGLAAGKSLDDQQLLATVPGLAYKISGGSIRVNPQVMPQLSQIKSPDYDFIDIRGYAASISHFGVHRPGVRHRVGSIMATRGCPYLCQFCSARDVHGLKVRTRPIESIIEEIRLLKLDYGITAVNIIDDNFTFNMHFAKEVCRQIIREGLDGLSYACPNGVRMEWLDQELLGLMKQAGFYSMMLAPESGSLPTLKRMQKNVDLGIVKNKVRMIRRAGMHPTGAFIVGYPGETIEDVKQTVRFARGIDFSMIAYHVFQPLPGSPIFRELVEKGEISGDTVAIDMHKVNYCPRTIDARQLRSIVKKAYVFSVLGSLRRILFLLQNGELKRILRYAYHLLR